VIGFRSKSTVSEGAGGHGELVTRMNTMVNDSFPDCKADHATELTVASAPLFLSSTLILIAHLTLVALNCATFTLCHSRCLDQRTSSPGGFRRYMATYCGRC